MYNKRNFDSFSFGCRVNEAEKIVMDQQMIRAGFLYNKQSPDVYIINSCAVTAKAEHEARQLILRLKREYPSIKMVVTGCSATYWLKNNLWKNIPIDLLISNIDKNYLVTLIKKRFSIQSVPIQLDQLNEATNDKFLSSGRVMIKIQDGCHRFCSYCIVPYLRGTPKSKKIEQIITDITHYNRYNHYPHKIQEVIFTAINTESFGHDTGESLIQLIDKVLSTTDIPRISFGSIHPWSINDEFIQRYKKLAVNPQFSNFFHVPIQSGSNKILRLMKRDYVREDILEKLNKILKINPMALIATDIIVGYLDESEQDFKDTYSFLEASPINKFHVFRFSTRQNTAAYYQTKRLKEPSASEKIKRSKALSDLSVKKYLKFLIRQVGTTSQALFIGEVKEGFQKAILNNQILSWIKTDVSLRGKMKRVKITGLSKNNLKGEIV